MAWKLSVEPRAPVVLADGPMSLSLALQNTGAAEAAVPRVDGAPPFEYSIRSADGATFQRSASRAERREADLWLADVPPLRSPDLVVAPGRTARFDEDLMSLLTEPLEPGRYVVEASYRSPEGEACTSEPVALEVVASKPHAIAQDIAVAEGRVVIAEWHRNADGTTLLRARQTGLAPLGRFFELATLDTAEPVRQCAMSTNVAYGILDAWRWLAWSNGTELLAGVAHEDRFIYPSRPIPLELEAPSLLPFGYTTGDAGAIFVVVGRRAGRAHIRSIAIPPGRDAEPVSTDVRLEDLPDAVPGATCIWAADGPPELVLSWVVEADGTTSILLARVNARSGEVLAPPRDVFTTHRSVLAVGVPPTVGPDERRYVQLLLAPAASDGSEFTHVTFDLADPATAAARELPSLPAFAARGVDRWVLPSEPLPGAPVLAVGGSEIWAAARGAWTRIATGDVEPSSVRLWALPPARLICSWFDRARGYRWQRLSGSASVSNG